MTRGEDRMEEALGSLEHEVAGRPDDDIWADGVAGAYNEVREAWEDYHVEGRPTTITTKVQKSGSGLSIYIDKAAQDAAEVVAGSIVEVTITRLR